MQPNDLISNKLSQYVLDQDSEKIIREKKYQVVHMMLMYIVNSAWAQFVIENYDTGGDSKQRADWIVLLEGLSETLQFKSIADFEKYYGSDFESDWSVWFLETISGLLDVNYKPPMYCNLYTKDELIANPEIDPYGLEMRNLVLQLQALDFYYGYTVFIEPDERNYHLDFALDRALSQLLYQIGVRNLSATEIMKEHARILGSRGKVSKRKADRKQKAIETFYTIDRRELLSITTICKRVAERMFKDGYAGRNPGKPIDWTTIRGYLEEDKLLSSLKR